jgi:hypothetical protein
MIRLDHPRAPLAALLAFALAAAAGAEPFFDYRSIDGSYRFALSTALFSYGSMDAPLPGQEFGVAAGALWRAGSFGDPAAPSPDRHDEIGAYIALMQTLAGARAYFPYRLDLGLRAESVFAWPGDGIAARGPEAAPYADPRSFHAHRLETALVWRWSDAPYFPDFSLNAGARAGGAALAALDGPLSLGAFWKVDADVLLPLVPGRLGLALAARGDGAADLAGFGLSDAGLPRRWLDRPPLRSGAPTADAVAWSAAAELRLGLWTGEIPYLSRLQAIAWTEAAAAGPPGTPPAPAAAALSAGAELAWELQSAYGEHPRTAALAAGVRFGLANPLAAAPGAPTGPTPYASVTVDSLDIGMVLAVLLGLL